MKWSCMACSPTKCYDELFICIFNSRGGVLGLQITNQIQDPGSSSHWHLIYCQQDMMLTLVICSEAGTNSTALSSGANSPQLERHVIPAMGVSRQTRPHPETVASPQYQVRSDIETFISLWRALNKYFLYLRSVIPAWMSARDGKLTTQRWDMRR